MSAPPLPPPELRELIGSLGPEAFDNPSSAPIWEDMSDAAWRVYLDFGADADAAPGACCCSSGRPSATSGSTSTAAWFTGASRISPPLAPGFEFHHDNVYAPGLNPDRSRPWGAPLPVEDGLW